MRLMDSLQRGENSDPPPFFGGELERIKPVAKHQRGNSGSPPLQGGVRGGKTRFESSRMMYVHRSPFSESGDSRLNLLGLNRTSSSVCGG